MKTLQIYVNKSPRFSVDIANIKYVDVGVSIRPDCSYGELQCCVTPATNGNRELAFSDKINVGEIVSICMSDRLVENLFFEGKESYLKEMYQKTNLGNPCSRHLHIYNDKSGHSKSFSNERNNIQFDSIWDYETSIVNYSIGIFDNLGAEQWHQSSPVESRYLELLYFSN